VIDIIVIRGEGDRAGQDVVDPLIGSLPVALARGRQELDDQADPLQPVTVVCLFRVGLRLGNAVRFQDSRRGTWTGTIVGINHRGAGGVTSTTLQLRRKVIE
jgi:hypothetical protein